MAPHCGVNLPRSHPTDFLVRSSSPQNDRNRSASLPKKIFRWASFEIRKHSCWPVAGLSYNSRISCSVVARHCKSNRLPGCTGFCRDPSAAAHATEGRRGLRHLNSQCGHGRLSSGVIHISMRLLCLRIQIAIGISDHHTDEHVASISQATRRQLAGARRRSGTRILCEHCHAPDLLGAPRLSGDRHSEQVGASPTSWRNNFASNVHRLYIRPCSSRQ